MEDHFLFMFISISDIDIWHTATFKKFPYPLATLLIPNNLKTTKISTGDTQEKLL